jgi:hypothetical protein
VHPMGMAVDLSVGRNACHEWIEKTLLELERKGKGDLTRERRPLHYHWVLHPTEKLQSIAKKQ